MNTDRGFKISLTLGFWGPLFTKIVLENGEYKLHKILVHGQQVTICHNYAILENKRAKKPHHEQNLGFSVRSLTRN